MDDIMEYIHKVQERLAWYTVGFVRVKTDSREDNLFGSGTLVYLNKKHAILTAAHVVEELKQSSQVGLCLVPNAHRFILPKKHVQMIYVGWCGTITKGGPDLALVQLPANGIGTLKAQKSFYELSCMVDGGEIRPVDYSAGIFLAGFIGEWTREGPSEAGFDATKGFCMLTGGIGKTNRYWQTTDFDFCSLTVQCKRDNPHNYQGSSGGGLWKVIAKEEYPGVYKVSKAILCGVVYWQTQIAGDERQIICHGYRSIYRKALDALA